jgi:hypothetical protein
MKKSIFLILGLSTLAFGGKIGYLQQTIKSPKNNICIYKYNGSLWSVNVGTKSQCKKSFKLDDVIKR